MSKLAIKVEDLGKMYRLGEIGTGTLSHDLNRWWAKMRGKEDPFAKIGETNDRTTKGASDYVWSLKDVSFEVKQGEVLGIIGRNGAGKSTLLKILSRVTTPTTGQIKINGRIASLLEVGTGFHPELTGRENIFLNGAILGMTKAEIRSKFDEIVDFSGVERYIDTPVKRYSSGMYVRLAFAVAAFLEPEILIIDEVLAVGDAEFQKKCLGRIKDVSVNDGRTVLFVSHHLPSVKSLCTQALLLERGVVSVSGQVESVLEKYQFSGNNKLAGSRYDLPASLPVYVKKWSVISDKNKSDNEHLCYTKDRVVFRIIIVSNKKVNNAEFGFILRDVENNIVVGVNSRDNGANYLVLGEGEHVVDIAMYLPLKPGQYEVDIAIADQGNIVDHWVSDTNLRVLNDFDVVLDDRWRGVLNVDAKFEVYG
ncbi:ABC transporter ATP-binding protein [Hymenobacter busanensis]|uniref:ABC transporter ATP-binding protein n=1 Tax=Hymenobacter busanensis TaxID=2607656 RepID=A0A7L4ZVA3_9BACT|nr:ABC transporter ATP-binding protein [Hymenobacter busanensis]KAA9332264.1 ABC transporter ATP-binding protein [Hymenobacter busanensis]QHJ07399.1 ATP-binding cassette domain-containing protein [Hymenobacter busanensis]